MSNPFADLIPGDDSDDAQTVLQEPDSGASSVSDPWTGVIEGASSADSQSVEGQSSAYDPNVRNPNETNRDVSKVEQGLEIAKTKADAFTAEFGEERLWDALVEFAAGKATEGAIWLAENVGSELIDLLVLYATWSRRLSQLIPHKGARGVIAATSLFSLVGGSTIEAVMNKMADKGYLTEETAKYLNENGVEPLEQLNVRGILMDMVGDAFKDEPQPAATTILNPVFNLATQMAGAIGSNQGGPVSQRDAMRAKFYNRGGILRRK